MKVRHRFAAARVRFFEEAADAYVLRAQDDPRFTGNSRGERARLVRRKVMPELSTDKRRHLIHRFAQFFCIARAAGIDAINLCFDPPVYGREAKRLLAEAAPGWLTEEALTVPGRAGAYKVKVGTVPELCCFGFMATELFSPVMLRWMSEPIADTESAAKAMTADLASAVSERGAAEDLSDYLARELFRIVQAFEEIAGLEFEMTRLTDAQVLAAWQRTSEASTSGPSSYQTFLSQLSALAVEVWASTAAGDAAQAESIDDVIRDDGREGGASPMDTDWVAHVLSEPLVVELLTEEQLSMAAQQLDALAGLSGLDLTRARAITFTPLENRIIQAKRLRRDMGELVAAGRKDVSHRQALQLLQETLERVDRFLQASVHLLWKHGRAADAIHVALKAAYISGQDADRAALDADPAGKWGDTLTDGRAAWDSLRRRKAFARCDADSDAIEEMEEAAVRATQLRSELDTLWRRVGRAVGEAGEGMLFQEEYDTFCAALGRVHGFEFARAAE